MMNNLIELLHGTNSIESYIVFTLYTLVGMIIVKLVKLQIQRAKIKAMGKLFKFDFIYWLNDNSLDFILAFICAGVFHRFFPDMLLSLTKLFPSVPQFTDKMFYGLLLGLLFQYILHRLLNKFKIVNK